MITELQARRMTNAQVLEVLKKSCARHNQTLLRAQYNPTTVELAALVDEIRVDGGVDSDMDSVFIGLCNFNFNPVIDNRLQLQDEPCCPTTFVKTNRDVYESLVHAIGGVQLI